MVEATDEGAVLTKHSKEEAGNEGGNVEGRGVVGCKETGVVAAVETLDARERLWTDTI